MRRCCPCRWSAAAISSESSTYITGSRISILADEIGLLTFVGEQMGGAISKSVLSEENTRLLEETQEMKRQLETRKVVERAKGILTAPSSLTEKKPICACAMKAAACAGPCAISPRQSFSPRT